MLVFYNNIKNALINSGINYPMHASDNRLNIKLNDNLMCKIYSKSADSYFQTVLAYHCAKPIDNDNNYAGDIIITIDLTSILTDNIVDSVDINLSGLDNVSILYENLNGELVKSNDPTQQINNLCISDEIDFLDLAPNTINEIIELIRFYMSKT